VAAEQAQRVQQAAHQRAFDVAGQEALLEVVEHAVAVQAVVGREVELRLGDRADQADGIERRLSRPSMRTRLSRSSCSRP
jgi:hypothetical protein